jgi:hypothetical protein
MAYCFGLGVKGALTASKNAFRRLIDHISGHFDILAQQWASWISL